MGLDSVRLAEDDEVYLAAARSLRIDRHPESGAVETVWVTDNVSHVLMGFSSDGSYRTRIGAPGQGPGEFEGIGHPFRGPASLDALGPVIAVTDYLRFEIKWFTEPEGEPIRQTRHGRGLIGHSRPIQLGLVPEEKLLFPMMTMGARSALGVYHVDSDRWEYVATLPEPYQRSLIDGAGGFAVFFSRIFVAPWDSTGVLIAYAGVPEIEYFDYRTGAQRVLGRVPERFRKGQPNNLWRMHDVPGEFGPGLPFDWASVGVGMWTLSDGRVVMLHIDDEYEGTPPRLTMRSTSFMTVLYPNDTACVDLLLPFGEDTRPVMDLSEDRLFVLDRRITEDLEPQIWLFSFPIPEHSDCPAENRARGWKSGDEGAIRGGR